MFIIKLNNITTKKKQYKYEGKCYNNTHTLVYKYRLL